MISWAVFRLQSFFKPSTLHFQWSWIWPCECACNPLYIYCSRTVRHSFLKILGDTVRIHYDFSKERPGESHNKTYKRTYISMAQGDVSSKYASPRSSSDDTHCTHAASGHVFLVWLLCVRIVCLRVIHLLNV